MTHTTLAAGPSMDDHKIGPAGQTFGQLKQDVKDTWAAFLAALAGTPGSPVCDAALDAHDAAVRLLKAAYVRVGLPYVTP